jgi:hypothetical protein
MVGPTEPLQRALLRVHSIQKAWVNLQGTDIPLRPNHIRLEQIRNRNKGQLYLQELKTADSKNSSYLAIACLIK